jgi:uncharacterized protein YcbX
MFLAEINVYPIKSLKGVSLRSSVVDERGIRSDRRWMLTDREGRFLTQREEPKMARLATEITAEGIRVMAGERDPICVAPISRGKRSIVRVWESEVEAIQYDRRTNRWFSDALGREVCLVYMPESSRRPINKLFDRGDDIVSFADGYPVLLAGYGSLEELNRRIADTAAGSGDAFARQISMQRFRPNLVIGDCEAFIEDSWSAIKVGDAKFRVTKPCARCVVTTVDPERGEFDGVEPLRTLSRFRKARDVMPDRVESFGLNPNSVLFGVNLVPENPGAKLKVGDRVEAIAIH